MSLASGTYNISSYETGLPIGVDRKHTTDSESAARKVITLPHDYSPHKWELEKQSDGSYIMKINGATATTQNGLLFALPSNSGPKPTKWDISKHAEKGENTYAITEAEGRHDTWDAPKSPNEQISVHPVGINPNYPGRFFVITK